MGNSRYLRADNYEELYRFSFAHAIFADCDRIAGNIAPRTTAPASASPRHGLHRPKYNEIL